MNWRVLVIQRRMTHYRVAFFERLRNELSLRGITLSIAYGCGTEEEEAKGDSAELSWATKLRTRYFFGGNVCWQPFSKEAAGFDLVVVTPENKLVWNCWEQYFVRDRKVALWGHGSNLQGDPNSFREYFKRIVARRADWWFGYTEMSVPLIGRSKFPRDRVTVLNNSVDTTALANMRQNVTSIELKRLALELGLRGSNVGVYVGSLYKEKRIGFMLEAVKRIHEAVPDFEFLIMGSGLQQSLVENFCQENAWAKYLGMKTGPAKINAMALAKVMINPGLVGLGILDSFVCGVPIVTTDCGLHSPEIAYLKNGENGLMSADSIDEYVASVVALLADDSYIEKMKLGCKASAVKYTVENMARNFSDGVVRCLETPSYRGSKGAKSS